MGNKQGGAAGAGVEEESARDQNGEEGEEEVELPPPMKPINEPILVPSDDAQGQRVSPPISIYPMLCFNTYLSPVFMDVSEMEKYLL